MSPSLRGKEVRNPNQARSMVVPAEMVPNGGWSVGVLKDFDGDWINAMRGGVT